MARSTRTESETGRTVKANEWKSKKKIFGSVSFTKKGAPRSHWSSVPPTVDVPGRIAVFFICCCWGKISISISALRFESTSNDDERRNDWKIATRPKKRCDVSDGAFPLVAALVWQKKPCPSSFSRIDLVLLGFTGFHLALLSYTEFRWVFKDFI